MNLEYSPEETAFRHMVREWIAANLPDGIRKKVLGHRHLTKSEYVGWHRLLAEQGWAAPAWPTEYGGPGWSAVQRHIWDEECGLAGAPPVMPFGVSMVAPVIMKYGSAAQKDYFLPRILDCTDWWCQGYSEPGAGSDLASVRTRAERNGDHYLVNGQKTWTTYAQHADMMFCLVRTDPEARKQEGISFLLIDMKSPGVTVRPIITLDEQHEVNEVFLDNVKVPLANLVGEENRGWTYAKYLLGHERTGIAGIGQSKRELGLLKALALRCRKDGRPLLHDQLFAAKVASVEIDLMALEVTVQRIMTAENSSDGPGPEASMLKIVGTEIQQALSALMMQAVGPQAAGFDPAYISGECSHAATGDDEAACVGANYFITRKTSIYGGANEIQKNIIAHMILGL
ncbi:acyl-CoA dehydrogenase family protein [Burkholderia multivorans]|uniref:acyl-CoA dehydrogenase family protein n=1 Tax=Burkholderia multivorans TaxID=87883 RepID=UPI0019D2EEB7|nr:acyl-CoA dehydrogenase family protein [Burkholderia multivorans]MBN6731253.1 acyl-CoA dehydrogenase family protein [Burkholderia multivorans]MBN6733477.1 acyl-CoA dehydrogenase family protein [Burkholderia multivorans]MBN7130385.1 pimeloyl-CoA dehydrogenase large subunit [Burkholderia multivorans]MBN8165067.1 pimeloyl-CoA dehydrogenase large subunit [Burkholderia multivorans]MBN8170856.1 pimeloyl-CoA dehydrogenase large subunit [Burkholderia multivorans]